MGRAHFCEVEKIILENGENDLLSFLKMRKTFLTLYDRRSDLHKSRFEITAIENFVFDDIAVQPSLGF